MPTDFSALIDTVLVLAGLALVATGLVMFIYSKTSTQASSVEAFGIKLNVTHPSLILVLAGVGLMLAPRLLPGLPGMPNPPAAIAEVSRESLDARTGTSPDTPPSANAPDPAPAAATRPAPSAPVDTPSTAPTLSPRPYAAMQTPAPAPAPSRVAPAPSPVATAPSRVAPVQTAPAAKPRIATPPTAASQPAEPKPAAAPLPSAPQPAAPQLALARPAATPAPSAPVESPPAKPARPALAYAALGLPAQRDFWSGETRSSYTQRIHTSLQQTGRDVLKMEPRALALNEQAFNAWWNESNQHPRSRELCAGPNAPRALLSARVEASYSSSTVESAYWPELSLRLFDCSTQRVHRQKRTLSPQNADAWPFSVELNTELERFMRTYRADLTD
ncbi:MAG: hypothetical protein Q8R61_01875 [Thiobacillus sp.]|uniref:hypothetical protein n=1 Tax=Thiobacillus sp. TaxID=924 RepID=UPI0027330389|nr:hypothetical protein [Thiobacillus sp.]MDP3583846.1 hypothetical protein [Thiobacillus sp.]